MDHVGTYSQFLSQSCFWLVVFWHLSFLCFVFSESGEMCAMKEVTLFSDDAKSKESAKQLGQVSTFLV